MAQIKVDYKEEEKPKKQVIVKQIGPNYEQEFPSLFNQTHKIPGIRPKKHTKENLRILIENIYGDRFVKEIQNKKVVKGKKSVLVKEQAFPCFVMEYLYEKFKTKQIVYQQLLNLTASLVHFEGDKYFELFKQFIKGEYSIEELTFFLLFRAALQKETGVKFEEKAKQALKLKHNTQDNLNADLYLNIKECANSDSLSSRRGYFRDRRGHYSVFLPRENRSKLNSRETQQKPYFSRGCTHFGHGRLSHKQFDSQRRQFCPSEAESSCA